MRTIFACEPQSRNAKFLLRYARATIRMFLPTDSANPFPTWARWTALIWLAIWLAIYLKFWGPDTFLFLCDIAVILTCLGLYTGNALLLSSQAVSSIVIDTVWLVDIATKLIFNRHLIGGTDYFFDTNYPLWVRLMSCFHVVMPFVLIAALRRTGYDRRALGLQFAIAAVAMIASRFAAPARNINFVYLDPILHRQWGPAPIHVGSMLVGMTVVIYAPTHLVLARMFPAPAGEPKPR
jgi:hypothetical protein